MNICELNPQPSHCETFQRNRDRFVPNAPGCYALTTFEKVVLYIGLTDNLRRRMNDHLDSSIKTRLTGSGRAFLFHWIETSDTNKIERTWMNIHIQHEGALPVLNSLY